MSECTNPLVKELFEKYIAPQEFVGSEASARLFVNASNRFGYVIPRLRLHNRKGKIKVFKDYHGNLDFVEVEKNCIIRVDEITTNAIGHIDYHRTYNADLFGLTGLGWALFQGACSANDGHLLPMLAVHNDKKSVFKLIQGLLTYYCYFDEYSKCQGLHGLVYCSATTATTLLAAAAAGKEDKLVDVNSLEKVPVEELLTSENTIIRTLGEGIFKGNLQAVLEKKHRDTSVRRQLFSINECVSNTVASIDKYNKQADKWTVKQLKPLLKRAERLKNDFVKLREEIKQCL